MRSFLVALRSSPRRVWCTSFVLLFGLTATWAFTTPQFGAGDEASHVSRATALGNGVLTGEERENAPEFARFVEVPYVYATIVVSGTCYYFEPARTPSCARFHGPSTPAVKVRTDAGRHPPSYYAYVGVLTSWLDPLVAIDGMRLLTAALCAALLASAIVTVRRARSPSLAALGIVVALTPTSLYLMGVVNPNGPEVAAAIALWISGFALVTTPEAERIDSRLLARVGIAASVLVLTRQTSPFWLLLIAIALVCLSRRRTLRALAASTAARWWAALVAACIALQLAWIAIVKPLDVSYPEYAIEGSLWSAVKAAAGDIWPNYVESIGMFGWFNDVAPTGVIVLWTAVIAVLCATAWTFAPRRIAWVLAATLAAVLVVPTALEAMRAREAGLYWQGRYTLPLAVGVPILAAMGLSESTDARRLRRIATIVAGAAVVGQIVAFAQQLRRWTVGYRGPFDFVVDWDWSRAAPPWLLLGGFTALMVALGLWLCAGDRDDATLDAVAP